MSRADFMGSTTNPETRDRTRTPLWLFKALDSIFHFQVDVACLPETALCDRFITPNDDSLAVDWADYLPDDAPRAPYVWLNPPYSNILPWVRKAAIERVKGVGCVMLVPLDKSAKWYGFSTPNRAIEIVGGWMDGKWQPGRVNFVDAITGEEIKGNPKGSMLLVFNPGDVSIGKSLEEMPITHLLERAEVLGCARGRNP